MSEPAERSDSAPTPQPGSPPQPGPPRDSGSASPPGSPPQPGSPPAERPPPSLVDWEFAAGMARRLGGSGPKVSPEEATDIVADLHEVARLAHSPVAQTSQMVSPPGSAPVLVVDRPGWARANIGSMRALLEPVIAKVQSEAGVTNGAVAAVGGKVTGAEVGAILAFMSGKILGQYDLAPAGNPALLLVAPNIVQAERELEVVPRDFRLWVAMHEETHRVQFTAVPWLREHMVETTRALSLELAPTPAEMAGRLQQLVGRLPEVFGSNSAGLAEMFLTPAQKAKVDQVTAVMSLIEGHAEVVMDDVGPAVIPTVAQIRERFTRRRQGMGQLDRLLRRLLGLEAKMRQYADGAVFVRAVVGKVGLDGFNAVWTSPQTLPTPAEMADPQRWVMRVHG